MDKARIEWSDVQGIVRRGFGELAYAAYVLLTITDPARARAWLGSLDIASGDDVGARARLVPLSSAVNIAFTFPGLCALGFEAEAPGGFPREFCEGMAPEPEPDEDISRRSGMLGDVDPNDPYRWRWGGLNPRVDPVHAVLMVFGESDAGAIAGKLVGDAAQASKNGVRAILTLEGWLPKDQREHFGFRDGMSQPILREDDGRPLDAGASRLHHVAPGEFLIGYRNERGNFPVSPRAPEGADFGRNGTYLVMRELEQNVAEFEACLNQVARDVGGTPEPEVREWLAAKIIGRWRNGAPLTRYPESANGSEDFGIYEPGDRAQTNDFYYHAEDREGFRCPVGAHIRRAWPRDSLGTDPQRALLQAQLHRILRRGRLFGPRYDRDYPDAHENAERRGLYFICLNADIAGQFEAVQHNWINNPKFAALTDERDPLLGERDGDDFLTIPQSPINLRANDLKAFVKTCGGGYFFLPGLAALRSLSDGADSGPLQASGVTGAGEVM